MSDPSAQQDMASAVRLHSAGQWEQAERICRAVLADDPNELSALQLLGVLAGRGGRAGEAVECLRKAARLRPDAPQLHYNLGKALRDAHDLEAAADSFRRALALRPDIAPAWNNLGNTCRELGRVDEAVDAYQRSLKLRPNHARTLHNLGLAYRESLKLDDAMRCFDTALAFDPSHHECRVSRAMVLLTRGDFERGFAEYEARAEVPRAAAGRPYPQPLWDGLDPQDRTILLHFEQGFGDTIQFARYAPLLAARGAQVIVECQPELKELFRTLEGVSQVIAAGDALPDFEYRRGLMSMPMLMHTTLATVPAEGPYLSANRTRIIQWNQRIASAGRRIGIVWAGAPGYMNDRKRSLRLEHFAPLARAAHVTFVSLQKGPAAQQAANPPEGMALVNLGPGLRDFADTAAAIENLDLVISADTAVAHLAGALGAPVWMLVPFAADWRWLLGRDDTPWYPTMRLFRQTTPGDWDAVIGRMAMELEALLL